MNESDMMHGQHYNGQDIAGWICTEKLDGVRAYWDGATMWTRGGKAIDLPDTWRETLPAGVHLDGELFAGYGRRQLAVNAARYGRWHDAVRFVAFDAPNAQGNYLARLRIANQHAMAGYEMSHSTVQNTVHAFYKKQSIKAKGGEGLMLRHPELEYHPGRTHLMLKLK